MGLDGWLDAGVWFMSEVNYVFGCLYLKTSENDTKSRKYFQAQIESDRMLTRGYIARISSRRSDSEGLRLQKLEIRELLLAGADSESWCRKINNERYPLCIW